MIYKNAINLTRAHPGLVMASSCMAKRMGIQNQQWLNVKELQPTDLSSLNQWLMLPQVYIFGKVSPHDGRRKVDYHL